MLIFSVSCVKNDHIPKKKSELNNWHRLKIIRVNFNLCELIFPEEFGNRNKVQLMVLRELVNSNFIHDVDCVLQVNYATLNQILNLATKKQDLEAATMLLDPERYGGFNLDGELAEEYAGQYQLPVLEKNILVRSLLKNKGFSEKLADSFCSWLEVLAENEDKIRVIKLIQDLKKENYNYFTDNLISKCGRSLERILDQK